MFNPFCAVNTMLHVGTLNPIFDVPVTVFISICEHHKHKTVGGKGKILFLNL
jgi:hypothetical protein